MEFETLEQIITKRKEIEQELNDFLKKARSDFTLEDIQEIIYEEEGSDALTKVISKFDTGQGELGMSTILETVNDAWNYFPHKILGGISPAEMLLGHQKRTEIDASKMLPPKTRPDRLT